MKFSTKILNIKLLITSVILILLSNGVLAQGSAALLGELQSEWAIANYQLKNKEQIKAFESLIVKAESNLTSNPNNVEIQIWTGIIKSTLAGAKGGVGALSLAKAAKSHFEKALELDDEALAGSAYTSLGVLYNKVPGWPIGFGDKKKSVKNLEKGLQINPEGIDANYFYADYLHSKKKYSDAKAYYEKALEAQPRVGREAADAGRRAEIELALAEIQKKT